MTNQYDDFSYVAASDNMRIFPRFGVQKLDITRPIDRIP
jgi:hypothetical protein